MINNVTADTRESETVTQEVVYPEPQERFPGPPDPWPPLVHPDHHWYQTGPGGGPWGGGVVR